MSLWEDRVHQDAEAILRFLVKEYKSGKPEPLSIARLSSRLQRPRERIAAALAVLVICEKKLGVLGTLVDSSRFYPLDLLDETSKL